MKPREQGGVVDERLNVYGVQNLKIVGNYPIIIIIIFICDTYFESFSLSLFFIQTAVSHQAT